jgi:hypothetical protein
MGDDNLFAGNEAPAGGAEGDKGGAEGAGFNLEALQEEIAKAVTSAQSNSTGPIVEALTNLNTQVQELQAAAEKGNEPPPQEGDVPKAFQDLYDNTDEKIGAVALESVKNALGPALRLQFEQTRDSILDQEREAVERDLGPGAWGEFFESDMATAMAKIPLEMQASRDHVTNLVAILHGRKDRDPEGHAAFQERRAKVARDAAPPPVMLDGSRPRPRGDTVTQEERDFVASLQRSGIPYTVEQYVKARERGTTESAWKKEAAK